MRRAFQSGGKSALTAAKNELYVTGGAAPPPAAKPDVPQLNSGGEGTPWELEAREDGRAFRATCFFAKSVHYDSRNLKPIKVQGPWRDVREMAERDAIGMCGAFEQGGVPEVQKLKNELFRGAFVQKPGASESSKGPPASTKLAARSRSRDRSASGARERERSRERQGAEFRSEIERGDRGYRVHCHLPAEANAGEHFKKSRTGVELTGPWRRDRSHAEEDGRAIANAYSRGGMPAASKKKNEFFRGAAGSASQDSAQPDTGSCAFGEAAASSEDERVEAVRGGFRAVCKFLTQRDTSISFRKSAGSISMTGPTRATSALAIADADALEAAYAEGGTSAAHKVRNDIFRNAFREKPDVEAVPESEPSEGTEVTLRSCVEADRADRGKGYRAACQFPSTTREGVSFTKNVHLVSVLGPWRTGKNEAEADEAALVEAYQRGGLEAAQSLKHDLRRNVMQVPDGVPLAAAVIDKLSKDDMADKYGKGYLLAQRMGYAGAGLGREEQGREMPVSLDGARTSVGSASRLGLGSSGDSRGTMTARGGDSDDGEGGPRASLGASGSTSGRASIAFEKASTRDEPPADSQQARAAPPVGDTDSEDDASTTGLGAGARWRARAFNAVAPPVEAPRLQATPQMRAVPAFQPQRVIAGDEMREDEWREGPASTTSAEPSPAVPSLAVPRIIAPIRPAQSTQAPSPKAPVVPSVRVQWPPPGVPGSGRPLPPLANPRVRR